LATARIAACQFGHVKQMISLPFSTPVPQSLQRLLPSRQELFAVLRSAAQVFLIRLLGAGLTYAAMVLMARSLGSHDFGIYAFVSVVIMLLALGFSFGFNSSGLSFVSNYLARRKLSRLSGFLLQSYRIVFGLSSLGAMLVAGLLFTFRNAVEPYYLLPLLVGLICVPICSLLNQFEATARAFGWIQVAYVPGYIVRPLLLMGFVGTAVLFGCTVDAVTALWALVGACAIAMLGQGLLVILRTRKNQGNIKSSFHTRHWLKVSLGFLMIDGFRMLMDNTDVILIGWFLDPHSVAVYFAVIRTSGLVAFVSFSVIALAVPKFAEIHNTGTTQDLQKFVSAVIHLMFWPSLLLAIGISFLGPFLLTLFGGDFQAGYPTMLLILTGLLLRTAAIPVEYLLNMTGYHRDTMRVYAFAGLANVVLNLLLIPAFGILGAALGTYSATLGASFCLYHLVRKRLGVRACLFASTRWKRQAGVDPMTYAQELVLAKETERRSVHGST
jgi:O-antigen/teichoic acid export membrane protein